MNRTLKLLSLNVCGLKSKLLIPEFIDLCNEFDILTCFETKLDDLDIVKLDHHMCIAKNRKQKVIRKSGGIAVMIKENILKYFEYIDSECEYVLWFKLDKILFNSDEDFYFGCVYVPPAYTDYSQNDILDLFYQEIENNSRLHKHVFVLGDFNARTSDLADVTITDDAIFEQIGVNPETVYTCDTTDILKRYNLDVQRASKDTKVNTFGKHLIEFCKNNDMIILNGRAFHDKGVGKTTCKNTSVVDYVICSTSTVEFLSNYEVRDFCPLFSDAHNPIEMSLTSHNDDEQSSKVYKKCKVNAWEESKSNVYVENLDRSKLQEVEDKLDSITSPDKDTVNDIMRDIEDIFIKAKNKTFSKYIVNENQSHPKNQNKKWFNNDCRHARQKFHLARRIYNNNKSHENRKNLLESSKMYKKQINKSILKHKRSMRKKVREMRQKTPKDYWNYINSLNHKKVNSDIKLESFFDFFKNINNTAQDDDVALEAESSEFDPEMLNCNITEDEILRCVKKLKNGKCSGLDNIINEYIKISAPELTPIYVKLFNIILDSGCIPESWLIGVIKPLYKNKGDPNIAENYRPITILSCMGKLFTSVLNNRLNDFLEVNYILNENQCGFRSGYSTCDNIFILHAIIEYLRVRKLKLYCAFIDFQKAFDSVWRVGLWSKLLNANVTGKILNVIKNMYADIKSCISFNGKQSEFFDCRNGVRQGENLSPILFSLFLNDLEGFLLNQNNLGINIIEESLQSYLKLVVLLYADDTILFAESEEELQELLNEFHDYCTLWKLNVNIDKSKIVIFGDRTRLHKNIMINDTPLEIVDSYKYLGVLMPKSRSFHQTKKHAIEQARKALFGLYRKIRNLELPLDCQLKLFDNTILPILTYGAEIWGYGDLSGIEKVHTDFLKYILNVKSSTPHVMLYGELGRFPISLTIKKRVISFWSKMLLGKSTKLSYRLYSILKTDLNTNSYEYPWLLNVKSILDEIGKSEIWINQNPENTKWLSSQVYLTLQDQYKQSWSTLINESPKCINYRIFKTEHKFENYLIDLPFKLRKNFTNFRLCNNKLPIETGRWHKIDRHLRKCNRCNANVIGDEYHFIFQCSFFDFDRSLFAPFINKSRANCILFSNIFNETNKVKLRRLCKFLGIVLESFQSNPG